MVSHTQMDASIESYIDFAFASPARGTGGDIDILHFNLHLVSSHHFHQVEGLSAKVWLVHTCKSRGMSFLWGRGGVEKHQGNWRNGHFPPERTKAACGGMKPLP